MKNKVKLFNYNSNKIKGYLHYFNIKKSLFRLYIYIFAPKYSKMVNSELVKNKCDKVICCLLQIREVISTKDITKISIKITMSEQSVFRRIKNPENIKTQYSAIIAESIINAYIEILSEKEKDIKNLKDKINNYLNG